MILISWLWLRKSVSLFRCWTLHCQCLHSFYLKGKIFCRNPLLFFYLNCCRKATLYFFGGKKNFFKTDHDNLMFTFITRCLNMTALSKLHLTWSIFSLPLVVSLGYGWTVTCIVDAPRSARRSGTRCSPRRKISALWTWRSGDSQSECRLLKTTGQHIQYSACLRQLNVFFYY